MTIQAGIQHAICCLCRMAAKQLEQLNGEIAELNVKVGAAKKDWLSATDPHQEAKLEKAYEDAKEKEKRLLQERRALEAKLPGAGERTPLLPCQQHQAL